MQKTGFIMVGYASLSLTIFFIFSVIHNFDSSFNFWTAKFLLEEYPAHGKSIVLGWPLSTLAGLFGGGLLTNL